MEIPARYFFWFWSLIGFTFLKLGLDALHKTELSSSVSPTVMFLFRFSLVVSSYGSFTYAVAFRPQKISIDMYIIVVVIVYSVFFNTFVSFAYLNLLIFVFLNLWSNCFFFFFESYLTTDATLASIKIILIFTIMFFTNKLMCTAGVMLAILYWVFPYIWKEDLRDKWLHYMLPAVSVADSTGRKMMKRWAEFAVGMVGTILFQSFFRLTSFHQVVVFFYFAVAWLANIVLVSASHDFGVFNFLLGNVLVGCSVSEYGLRGTTWIAYGAAVVLYGLRMKLDSLALVNREGEETQVVIW